VPLGFYDDVTLSGSSTSVPPREKCRACEGKGVMFDPLGPAPAAPRLPYSPFDPRFKPWCRSAQVRDTGQEWEYW
jgi:hypothetical protein